MTAKIPYPLILSGETVDLVSLDKSHFAELGKAAINDSIWEFTLNDCSTPDKFNKVYEDALIGREQGSEYAFVVLHKPDNKLIGSTRFLDIDLHHKKLEIGWTWYHPDYWATEVNLECKLLLLTYCFETLNTNRVQIITDQNNLRSRKAIEKIGGKFEGILRNDFIRDNGTKRSSAYYSIIDEEWDEVKKNLTLLYRRKINKSNDL